MVPMWGKGVCLPLTSYYRCVAQLAEQGALNTEVVGSLPIASTTLRGFMMSRNDYMNSYMKNRYKNRRLEAVKLLGGCCSKCGGFDKLHFDHINPEDKSLTIAKMSSASNERFNQEIKKCQLLCESCHKIKTTLEGSLSNYDKETVCKCGRIFYSIKTYAGHKTWCKVK